MWLLWSLVSIVNLFFPILWVKRWNSMLYRSLCYVNWVLKPSIFCSIFMDKPPLYPSGKRVHNSYLIPAARKKKYVYNSNIWWSLRDLIMTAAMNVMTVIKAKSALIKYNSWMLLSWVHKEEKENIKKYVFLCYVK